MGKKRILLDIDEPVYRVLKKAARDQDRKLKPFAEIILRKHAERFLSENLVDVQKNDKSHVENLST